MGRVDIRWRYLVSPQHQGRWQLPPQTWSKRPAKQTCLHSPGSISSLHLRPVPTTDLTGNGTWLYFHGAIFLLLFSFILSFSSDDFFRGKSSGKRTGLILTSLPRRQAKSMLGWAVPPVSAGLACGPSEPNLDPTVIAEGGQSLCRSIYNDSRGVTLPSRHIADGRLSFHEEGSVQWQSQLPTSLMCF